MSSERPHLTPPKIKEPTPDPSGNLLWIAFAGILNVAALLLLFAIFRDTGATANLITERDRVFMKAMDDIQKQNDILLLEVRKLEKASGIPASEPTSAP